MWGSLKLKYLFVVLSSAVLIFAVFSGSATAQGKRFALVIGNSNYEHVADLANPVNDASDIASTLTKLGFIVTTKNDITRSSMARALRDFRASTIGSEQAVVYFAGHGIEIDRENYLVPVDARLAHDFDVEFEGIRLEDVVSATGGARKLGLVILDACRDNPFLSQMKRATGTRSIGRGLSRVEPKGNTLVAYAARAGTVASDGTGRNSPYAEALIETFSIPELEIGDAFRLVRDKVLKATGGVQEPFVYGSLSAERIYLSAATPRPPSGSAEKEVPSTQSDAAELAFWELIKSSQNSAELQAYLDTYPDGLFRRLAEVRLAALSSNAEGQSVQTETNTEFNEPEDNLATKPEMVELSRTAARDLQARLNILGLDAGTEDGLIGPRTSRAVAAYRKREGLGDGGSIDSALLSHLDSAVSADRLSEHREKKAVAVRSGTSQASSVRTVGAYCSHDWSTGGLSNGQGTIWINCLTLRQVSSTRIEVNWYVNSGSGAVPSPQSAQFRKKGSKFVSLNGNIDLHGVGTSTIWTYNRLEGTTQAKMTRTRMRVQ